MFSIESFVQKQIAILVMRMDGYTNQEIAAKFNMTRQGVSRIVKELTKEAMAKVDKTVKCPDMSNETKANLALIIVAMNGDVERIKERMGDPSIPVEEMMAFIGYGSKTRSAGMRYRNIQVWRSRNRISIRDLAEQLDAAPRVISSIFAGTSHLRLPQAQRLKEISGLSLRQIYQDDEALINQELNQINSISDTSLLPGDPSALAERVTFPPKKAARR